MCNNWLVSETLLIDSLSWCSYLCKMYLCNLSTKDAKRCKFL